MPARAARGFSSTRRQSRTSLSLRSAGAGRGAPVVEVVVDPRAMAVEERAVHVDGLVECVAPRLVQEAHAREVAAGGRHFAYPGGGRDAPAVEQDPLIVAGDPAHVDAQHPGRLDQGQPRQ